MKIYICESCGCGICKLQTGDGFDPSCCPVNEYLYEADWQEAPKDETVNEETT